MTQPDGADDLGDPAAADHRSAGPYGHLGASLVGFSGLGERLFGRGVAESLAGRASKVPWPTSGGLSGLTDAVARLNPDSTRFGVAAWTAGFAPTVSVLGADLQRVLAGVFPPPRVLSGLSTALSSLLPPNLQGVDLEWSRLHGLLVEEGLPLAWVPRQRLVERVLAAPDRQRRRLVYVRSFGQVMDDCEEVLAGCSSATLVRDIGYAGKAIAGMRDGHHELAQAMVANLLDSVLRKAAPELNGVRGRHKGAEPDEDLTPMNYFLHCSVWACYRRYHSPQDPVPFWFGRHPSAHAVSPRQYTKVNAALGLAHLTGVLARLDQRFSRGSGHRSR